jgi:hypothetical protein
VNAEKGVSARTVRADVAVPGGVFMLSQATAFAPASIRVRTRAAEHVLSVVPDHRGQARPVQFDLFADPPAGIGAVLSAESTLK